MKLFIICAFQLFVTIACAQDSLPGKGELILGIEFRPRMEYRNGYRQLRTDTSMAALFIEGRSRLYLTYQAPKFSFFTALQDVRVWGEQDPRSNAGSLQVYEFYVEPAITKNISIRLGRQKIIYDNQRFFSQNNWRQAGGAHDGIRFLYKGIKLEADLIGAFNQEKGAQDRFFGTDFSPDFTNYKILAVNFLKYTPSFTWTLSAMNAMDGLQDPLIPRMTHLRFTNGGRIEWNKKSLYATLAAYYQFGNTPLGRKLSAWYLQPEVKYKLSDYFSARLGAEFISGDDATMPTTVSHSFDALYGVTHIFLGTMDLYTRFPNDLNGAGIVSPYLFFSFNINKKLTIRADELLFFSQNNFLVNGSVINKYLGFENDLMLQYKTNSYTEIQMGYSWYLATKSTELIKKSGNHELWQDWAYLMITFKPELFRWTQKPNM